MNETCIIIIYLLSNQACQFTTMYYITSFHNTLSSNWQLINI